MIRTLREFENQFSKDTTCRLSSFEEKLKEITKKTESIDKTLYKLTHSNQIYITKIEKIDGILSEQIKMNQTLLNHEIKVSTCEKELSNACFKYDKIFIDNLAI